MLIYTRRRRSARADRQLRQVIGDAALIGWYDARFPWTIDAAAVGSWTDARGSSGYGPALVQATANDKPTWDPAALTVTFDGISDYLRVASATFNTITAAGALVYVGAVPSTVSLEALVAMGTNANAHVFRLARNASDGTFTAQADTDIAPSAARSLAGLTTGVRVLHGRRTASSAGNIDVAARIGAGTETVVNGASADQTWHTLTVGANHAGTVAAFSDIACRAVLVIKGTYTAAQQEAVAEWARAAHGASI